MGGGELILSWCVSSVHCASYRFLFVFLFSLLCAVNLSTEVTNKLRIYQEHFEKQYIDSTKEFYTVHGRACLSENGVQNYMNYVSAWPYRSRVLSVV